MKMTKNKNERQKKLNKKGFILTLTSFLLAVFFIAPSALVSAQALKQNYQEAPVTLKVPYIDKFHGFDEVDKNGTRSGYSYEYLRKIAQYTNVKYEFVDYQYLNNRELADAMNDALAKTKSGEYDLITNQNAIYPEDYEYVPYGQRYTIFCSLDGDQSYNKIIAEKKELRISVPKAESPLSKDVEDFCKRNDIKHTIVPSESNGVDMLKQGKADVIALYTLAMMEGLTEQVRFSPTPYYLAFTKAQAGVASKFLEAIDLIHKQSPRFEPDLYEKHYGKKQSGFYLTEEEKTVIASQTLNVFPQTNARPYLDNKDNKRHGIAIEVLKYITDLTGIKVDFSKETGTGQGANDLILSMPSSYDYADKLNFITSTPYVRSEHYFYAKRNFNMNTMKDKVIAVPAGSIILSSINYKKAIYYSSYEECIEAVSRGYADFGYGDRYSLNYYLARPTFFNVSLLSSTEENADMAFGLRRSADPVFLEVINRAISSLPQHMIEEFFVTQLATDDFKPSMRDMVYANPMFLLVSILLVCAVGISATVLVVINKNRTYKKFGTLANNISGGVAEFKIIDREIKLTYLNDGMSKLTGYSPQLLLQRNLFAPEFFSSVKDHYDLITDMKMALAQNKHFCTDFKFVKSDKSEIWLKMDANVIKADVLQAIIMDNTELKEYADKTKRLSQIDAMTMLLNKTTTEQACREALGKKSESEKLCLVLLDLDKFKTINDTFGHAVGDDVIKAVANFLKRFTPKASILGRVGGDEFLFLVKNARVIATVEKVLRTLLERLSTLKVDGYEGKIKGSFGAVLVSTATAPSFDECYKSVDALMYKAKQLGTMVEVKEI